MNKEGSTKALTLSTIAFAISFAVWGMISPMAKTFKDQLGLTDGEKWLLTAVPVLLGGIMRIPMGMLADRFGGRIVFGLLMIFVSLPAYMLSLAHSYQELLVWGFFLGMAGASFSVGIPFTSRWFEQKKQGFALGVYGAGNIGQSIALYGIPTIAAAIGGWQLAFKVFAVVVLVYGILFWVLAEDAPTTVRPKSLGEMMSVLAKNPMAWLLSLFYFVTFGGFVALSISLPNVLQDKGLFNIDVKDAGLRVAIMVVVATLMRPIGGWYSDKVGGAAVLRFVFLGAGVLAFGMTFSNIVPFTIGALGVAGFIGLGNGAVFKLVPQYFPKDAGTVSGLVGAIGALGGFFPPLLLAFIHQKTGAYGLGFALLALFCFVCLALNQVFLLGGRGSTSPLAFSSLGTPGPAKT